MKIKSKERPIDNHFLDQNEFELIEPRFDYESEFLAMIEEFRGAQDNLHDVERILDTNDFPTYIRWLRNGREGNVPAGMVPWSAFWLKRRDSRTLLGTSSLRHCLSPMLEFRGGHIGYSIAPSQRRQGYGSLILQLTLIEARKLGLRRVLVTCFTRNIASVKIITKNGGVFENEVFVDGAGMLSRYWIDLA